MSKVAWTWVATACINSVSCAGVCFPSLPPHPCGPKVVVRGLFCCSFPCPVMVGNTISLCGGPEGRCDTGKPGKGNVVIACSCESTRNSFLLLRNSFLFLFLLFGFGQVVTSEALMQQICSGCFYQYWASLLLPGVTVDFFCPQIIKLRQF